MAVTRESCRQRPRLRIVDRVTRSSQTTEAAAETTPVSTILDVNRPRHDKDFPQRNCFEVIPVMHGASVKCAQALLPFTKLKLKFKFVCVVGPPRLG
jgi:hypothetical protein